MPRPHLRASNPPNPWSTEHVHWLGEPPDATLEVYEETARSILSHNDSPDLPFRWSVNPYRGCQHACAYCYARPTHEYLGYGAGTDFDTKIVAKTNAPELLRRAFLKRTWKRELVAFSGVTDPYQPIEANYQLTRRCLDWACQFENPISIVTKSALVRRDVDLLRRLSRTAEVSVFLSIPALDRGVARAVEPGAASPGARLETIRRLADEGIPCGVAIAPMIPGLTDSELPEILERAYDAGARQAFMLLLRLVDAVRLVFEERLRCVLPLRAGKILNAWEACRAAQGSSRNAFGERFVGKGARYEAIERLFELTCRRLGFTGETTPSGKKQERRQLTLFDDDDACAIGH
ncbi:MAG: radical SAM protein [Planctomycetes bacterium]|nr:radical SAM protein [Planctomycetota bacterium]